MLQSDFMMAAMWHVADLIKARAEAMAPVGDRADDDPHIGRYKASFHTSVHSRGGLPDRLGYHRAEAIVYNDAPEAIYVEFGTRSTEGHHTLKRAAFG